MLDLVLFVTRYTDWNERMTIDTETSETRREPHFTIHHIIDKDGIFDVTARLLGFATSHRDRHTNHDPERGYMPPGMGRCSACRWIEVKILELSPECADEFGGQYIVHTHGRTTVPGEIELCNPFVSSSAFEILDFLTVNRNGNTFVPHASARSLAQAAQYDTNIREAWLAMRSTIH